MRRQGLHPHLQGGGGDARLVGHVPEARGLRQRRFLFGDRISGGAIGLRIFEPCLRVGRLFSSRDPGRRRKHHTGAERREQRLHSQIPDQTRDHESATPDSAI